jgi:hypothetical protein
MKRASLLLLVVAGLLAALQGTAAAHETSPSSVGAKFLGQWSGSGCGPFAMTQTYRDWGPARFYDRTVTVEYDATRCSLPGEDVTRVSIEGTATMYPGSSADGRPLDERAFLVQGTWRHASNREGWPLTWWECDVESLAYTWSIAGVYTFDVSAHDGVWSLLVEDSRAPVSWTYDACG